MRTAEQIENAPRELTQDYFYAPALARKGDKWNNSATGQHEYLTVDTVTKYTDSGYGSSWYVITFSDPLPHLKGLNIAEGLGMGTFKVGAR